MAASKLKQISLPKLPFGEQSATVSKDIDLYRNRLSTVITSVNRYDAIGNQHDFQSKTCVININGMKLVAAANTPLTVDIGQSSDTTLMVPFFGNNVSIIGSEQYRWSANESAMFIPAFGRGGYSGVRATLNIDIDPKRLQLVAQSMLGQHEKFIDLSLHQAREMSLHYQSFSFDELFRQLCGMINVHYDSARTLGLLGIDDLFYRNIAMMMRPDLFFLSNEGSPGRLCNGKLDKLCEYMRAHLDQSITLSEMERIAGMSARSLQYAFKLAFGMTPFQWLRDERLHAAHHRLKKPMAGDSVTSIAFSCGLGHLGQFSANYYQRFDELPSTTLARALKY